MGSTQDLILIGSGGCMRELLWQIEEQNKRADTPIWAVRGYVDLHPAITHGSSDLWVGGRRYPYLGDDRYLLDRRQETNVAISVGEPGLRQKIAQRLLENPNLKFPTLLMDNARMCQDVTFGKGCIVSMDCRISTNVSLGDFVFVNMGARICHDGKLGSYTTISPGVTAAGQVTIGEGCDIGMGANLIQGITVGSHTVVGAGSVVIRDIEACCMAAGVPAKRKFDYQNESGITEG